MQKNEQGYKQDIEQLLIEGNTIQIKLKGHSMYPLFVQGRDDVIVAPADPKKLKRGDVVLYRRDKSILVLHRIWKRKGDGFYLVGDNEKTVEGPLRPDQMKGVMIGGVRKGRKFSVKNPMYRLLSGIWLVMRPVRPVVAKVLKGRL